jgi:hypothetical protein
MTSSYIDPFAEVESVVGFIMNGELEKMIEVVETSEENDNLSGIAGPVAHILTMCLLNASQVCYHGIKCSWS